jgi:hypothetical protein
VLVVSVSSWSSPSPSSGWWMGTHSRSRTGRSRGSVHELPSGHVGPTRCAGGAPLTEPTDRTRRRPSQDSGERRLRPGERSATTHPHRRSRTRALRMSDAGRGPPNVRSHSRVGRLAAQLRSRVE